MMLDAFGAAVVQVGEAFGGGAQAALELEELELIEAVAGGAQEAGEGPINLEDAMAEYREWEQGGAAFEAEDPEIFEQVHPGALEELRNHLRGEVFNLQLGWVGGTLLRVMAEIQLNL